MWSFGKAVEQAMDEAEERLPKNAKDKTRNATRQRVLDKYLGIDSAKAGRFRTPGR